MKLCYHCMHQLQNEKAHICPQCGRGLKPEQQAARFLKPGTVLGRKFIVGEPLGAGGFGNTYIGWDNLLYRKIAIKEFYPEQYCARGQDGVTVTVTDERLQPRFQRGLQQFLAEARSVAALHEVRGVVEVSNFFEENGTGYMVMEYLEGMDVKTILQKSGDKKDYEWSRRVILTVLYTLREIHKRGVIHRDIAPDNIFVTDEGIIKLIDFGAAKNESALENSSDVMLKVGYAPIEQYKREFPQGPYTDLYAVAALFYRMLTGQKPIPAHERLEHDALIPPSEMGISLPHQAELAIMVCLNVTPEYRLQSAQEFMEALDGQYFIPVDEPEWILPPVEEKKSIVAKFASLPMAARVAACFAGIFIIGGAIFATLTVVRNTKNAVALDSKLVVMQDLQNKSGEEAAAYIDKLNREHLKWDIQFETEDSVFDLTKENGTVCSQSIASGTTLYDPEKEVQEVEGLTYDSDGKLTGTISCTLYSNEKICYSEVSDLNAYALAQKLGIDPSDEVHFVKAKEKKGTNYFDLASVEASGKMISAEELRKEKNQDKEITYSTDIKIYYYAPDFFYWKKLPDFAGKYGMLDEVPEQPVYRYTDENKKEKSGRKSLADSNLIDDRFCAIQSDEYEIGKIVGQTVAAGEEYDGSNPGDTPLEIQVIGTVFDYEGKTGREFADEIARHGFKNYEFVKSSGSEGNPDWKIEKVEVYQYDGNPDLTNEKLDDSKMEYFKPDTQSDNEAFFVITVKEPKSNPAPVQKSAPVPEPAPTQPSIGHSMAGD